MSAIEAPDGACSSCGCRVGDYSPSDEIVVCTECGTPWPSSYWAEQS